MKYVLIGLVAIGAAVAAAAISSQTGFLGVLPVILVGRLLTRYIYNNVG